MDAAQLPPADDIGVAAAPTPDALTLDAPTPDALRWTRRRRTR